MKPQRANYKIVNPKIYVLAQHKNISWTQYFFASLTIRDSNIATTWTIRACFQSMDHDFINEFLCFFFLIVLCLSFSPMPGKWKKMEQGLGFWGRPHVENSTNTSLWAVCSLFLYERKINSTLCRQWHFETSY